MNVEEIAPRLWRWTARHPDWSPGDDWEQEVGCVYYEAPDAVVLIDPLVPEEERDRFLHHLDADVRRAGAAVEILLTIFWHERSTQELVERYGARVWAHVEQGERGFDAEVTNPFSFGDPLPGGLEALDAHRRGESILWIPEHGALVAGDVLLGDGDGGVRICPDSWLPEHERGGAFRRHLRPLLALPVERVLVSHGEPVRSNGRAALERALA